VSAGAPERPSVVIAACNEEAVIGRCLDALLTGESAMDITVVANGCADRTAEVARTRGVRVVERPEPGKPGALNAGDRVAEGFPRVYLDADVVLSPGAVPRLAEALHDGDALAIVPRRVLDVTGRPLLVRAYFAINGRLPAYHNALFGRGAIALSAAGRARFEEFPGSVADDLYLDSLFAPHEKREVPAVASTVATPLRTRALIERLIRVRAGNTVMRAEGLRENRPGVRRSARSSWLRDVVLPRPWLAPAAVCYVAITVVAALAARRRPDAGAWRRDESTRQPAAATRSDADAPRPGE
jgi:glycosyltransferase involved in cell wall biosynthesis